MCEADYQCSASSSWWKSILPASLSSSSTPLPELDDGHAWKLHLLQTDGHSARASERALRKAGGDVMLAAANLEHLAHQSPRNGVVTFRRGCLVCETQLLSSQSGVAGPSGGYRRSSAANSSSASASASRMVRTSANRSASPPLSGRMARSVSLSSTSSSLLSSPSSSPTSSQPPSRSSSIRSSSSSRTGRIGGSWSFGAAAAAVGAGLGLTSTPCPMTGDEPPSYHDVFGYTDVTDPTDPTDLAPPYWADEPPAFECVAGSARDLAQ